MSGIEDFSQMGWDPTDDPMFDLNANQLKLGDEQYWHNLSIGSKDTLGSNLSRDISPGRMRNSPLTTLPLKVLERMNSDSMGTSTSNEANHESFLLDSDRPTHRSTCSSKDAFSPRSPRASARLDHEENYVSGDINANGDANIAPNRLSNTQGSDLKLPEIYNPDSPSAKAKQVSLSPRGLDDSNGNSNDDSFSRIGALTRARSELPSMTEKIDNVSDLRSNLLRSSSGQLVSMQQRFQDNEPRFERVQMYERQDHDTSCAYDPQLHQERDKIQQEYQPFNTQHLVNSQYSHSQQYQVHQPFQQQRQILSHGGVITDERRVDLDQQQYSPRYAATQNQLNYSAIKQQQRYTHHQQQQHHPHHHQQHQQQYHHQQRYSQQQQQRQQRNVHNNFNNSGGTHGGKKKVLRPDVASRNNNTMNSSTKNAASDPNGGTPHQMKLIRKAAADETLLILRRGTYQCESSDANGMIEVDITNQIKEAVDGAICYEPEYSFPPPTLSEHSVMVVEVMVGTTLSTCRKVWRETGGYVGCLAYASGKFPGGSFIQGSGGQEESFARSSAYYLCAGKGSSMYESNRANKDPFYSDHVVVSKNIPVFREEAPPHKLIRPWPISVVAAPAVNSGIVRERLGMEAEGMIHERMKTRIYRVLAAAHMHGIRNLVLGEYGCGALENNPRDVANYFKSALLLPESPFNGAFDRVVFAINDEIGSQSCGRQRIPCLPHFVEHICPLGKRLYVKRGKDEVSGSS